jgi:hypothetical protein
MKVENLPWFLLLSVFLNHFINVRQLFYPPHGFQSTLPWLQVLLERSVTGSGFAFVFQFAFTRRR